MARQVRPWSRKPVRNTALRARSRDQDLTSEFHQGRRLRPRSKVRIYGCNLYLLTITDRMLDKPGLPVLRTSPLCTCCRHYPGTAPGCIARSLRQTYQPSPHWRTGRPVQRPFRGLLSVHSRYGLHTRAVTEFCDTLHRRLQPFRCLHSCSGCFRLERLPGGTFTHWDNAAFSRRTPATDIWHRTL